MLIKASQSRAAPYWAVTAGPKSHSPEPMLVPASTIPGPINPTQSFQPGPRRLGKIADLPGGKVADRAANLGYLLFDRGRTFGGHEEVPSCTSSEIMPEKKSMHPIASHCKLPMTSTSPSFGRATAVPDASIGFGCDRLRLDRSASGRLARRAVDLLVQSAAGFGTTAGGEDLPATGRGPTIVVDHRAEEPIMIVGRGSGIRVGFCFTDCLHTGIA